jgi:hypothetical protein
VYFRALLALTAFATLTAQASVATFPQPSDWPLILSATVTSETIGPGVTYGRWKLTTSAGPLELSIATVDLKNPYVELQAVSHGDGIVGPGERLSSMADRAGAELGVNADYFDINETNSPLGALLINGRLLHQPDASAVFAADAHKAVFMGPIQWRASLQGRQGTGLELRRVNEWSQASDGPAELTPEFGAQKAFGASEMILTPANPTGSYTVARIDRNLQTFDMLSANQIGIALTASDADQVLKNFQMGDDVTLASQSSPELAPFELAVGGGPLLVRLGQDVVDPSAPAPEETDVPNPVTGVGVSADGTTLWLVVVDGRAPSRSIGLTRPQFAALFRALGAAEAMAFDSGGSSEMVVRHLGDTATEVANVPADGRERSIADGLFVVNSAPVGPPAQLLLEPAHPIPDVLAGSSLQLVARAVDANDRPLALAPGTVTYSVEPSAAASIDRNGMMSALRPGTVHIHASIPQAATDLYTTIVAAADQLKIIGADQPVPAGGEVKLSLGAQTNDGTPIVFNPSLVSWSIASGQALIHPDGTLRASPDPDRDVVEARLGSARVAITVLTGSHSKLIQALPTPGINAGQWAFASRPGDLRGAVDAGTAPDASPALRLSYDFSSQEQMTKAAYARTQLPIPGQPIGVSLEVWGDGKGEWLRGGYKTADGNNESVTIARHVDWTGWRLLQADIPRQASWPIEWTNLYVVEPDKNAAETGSLWFRNLAFIYAGP